jgi:phage tail sheath protein FI
MKLILLLLTLFATTNAFAIGQNPDYTVSKGSRAEKNQEWKYVQIQRYVTFLEESLRKDTQWVAFEPNNEALWARVQQSVADRLFKEWRNGKLMGSKPDQAYFVICNKTTMTQLDISSGRLICDIGIAPVKPAEFMVFQLKHNTAKRKRGRKKK